MSLANGMIQATLLKRALDCLLPPACICCGEDSSWILCPLCQEQLEICPIKGRCPRCLGPLSPHPCRMEGFKRRASCFGDSPVMHTLLQQSLHYENLPGIFASYLCIQLAHLPWEPEIISWIPTPFLDHFFQGEEINKRLARRLAQQMKVPFVELLSATTDATFLAKRGLHLQGEVILFVGQALHPSSRRALQALKAAGPFIAYSLTVVT